MIKCSVLDLERKTKVIQRSSGITNNRMAKLVRFVYNQFNRKNTTKRINDADVIWLFLHYRLAYQQTVRDLVHYFAMKP